MHSAKTDTIRENQNQAPFLLNTIGKSGEEPLTATHGRKRYQKHKNSVVHVLFPVAFRRICKIANSDYDVLVSCLSASSLNSSAPTRRTFMKFDIHVFFENLSRKFNSH